MSDNKFRILYKNKHILIPGGAGFLGSNLAKKLVEYGADVTIVDSFDALCGSNMFNISEIKDRIRLVRQKIEDFIAIEDISKYDIIFNCIGLTSHHIDHNNTEADYAVNCLSGLALLKKLITAKAKCRMISIGTRSQYGKVLSTPVDESHIMNPLDIHAAHKLLSEYYHSIFSSYREIDLVYLRLTNVYGPGQKLRGEGIGLIGEMIKQSIANDKIIVYGSTDRVKDILFVDDVVSALLLIGISKSNGFIIYNLGGHPCKLRALINAITKNIKIKTKILPFPDKIKKIDAGDVVLNTKRLQKATGWKPKIDIDKGISITLDYYQRYKKYYMD